MKSAERRPGKQPTMNKQTNGGNGAYALRKKMSLHQDKPRQTTTLGSVSARGSNTAGKSPL